ncbi:MAG: glycosyltransferase [Phycisphaerae bacterium]|nr:glycosyltransferase [Phycisphaerae bacterium]
MIDRRTADITFSFICPLTGRQEKPEGFYRRLGEVARGLGEPYEVIFVDDGSQADAGAVIRELAAGDETLRLVELSRSFGREAAVAAGQDYASGRAVISLGGEAWDRLELIGDLVARWREGFEVVCSPAGPAEQADFCLLDRKALDALLAARQESQGAAGLVDWIGFRRTSISQEGRKPSPLKGGFSLRWLAAATWARLLNSSLRPLRLAFVAGEVFLAAAIVYAVVSLLLWPFGAASGWTVHVIIAVMGLFGLQLLLLGVLGEYIGRIFDAGKVRPLYIVRETVGFPPEEQRTEGQPVRDEETHFSVFT